MMSLLVVQLLGIFTQNCCFDSNHGNQILCIYGQDSREKRTIDILNEDILEQNGMFPLVSLDSTQKVDTRFFLH